MRFCGERWVGVTKGIDKRRRFVYEVVGGLNIVFSWNEVKERVRIKENGMFRLVDVGEVR